MVKNIKTKKGGLQSERMVELEEEILREAECKLYLWWRYIDDIFFLWKHGEEKLKSFIDNINNMHVTITFTADWSKTSINFFDVTISIAEGIIENDTYVKPPDSHQYLLSSSCHPFHCKKRIPYTVDIIPDLDQVDRCKLCGEKKRPSCHFCENMKDTGTFKRRHLNQVHKIDKKYK